MTTVTDLNSWLDLIREMTPATGLLLVGGATISTLTKYAEWGLPSVMLVEADKERVERLSAVVQNFPNWTVTSELLTDHVGAANWYISSNPNENGLLAPERLTPFWQNLKTVDSLEVPCTTIDALFLQNKGLLSQTNYLIIDCLPALPILRGANKHLDNIDLVVVRAVLSEGIVDGTGATQKEIDAFMSEQGYRFIAYEEERQPAIGKLLYLRDLKKKLIVKESKFSTDLQALLKEKTDLAEARDQQTKLAAERQQQLEQLTKARDEQAKLAEDRRLQLETANKEKTDLAAARDQQTKLAAERQQQLEQLTKARDEQAKLATDRQTEIDKLKTSLQNAENKKSQLEAKLAEFDHRQQLMNEEMVRAEGQIDLIKDLLLREPGL